MVLGPVGLGHQHFWTTPEEVGERQPVQADGGCVTLCFDGRLDNRDELFGALGPARPEGQALSDAELVACAYGRWGERLCEHLLGPFALALYDAHSRCVLLGRDALGDRTLFYNLTPAHLIVGSEEGAVLAHPEVSAALDEATLASFFAVRDPAAGGSFYAQVNELSPAHCLLVDAEGARSWRYWTPDLGARLAYPSDEGYAEHFRELLTASVRCRLRSSTPVAVMMSGGLDSPSVAALAALQITEKAGGGLRTISFVFDELAACDEREYIQAVHAQYGTEAAYVPGDDAWPLSDVDSCWQAADRPDGNPYRGLKRRVYTRASQGGTRVLLSGGFSDHMYSGAEHWLADLLGEGRWAKAVRELFRYAGHQGLRGTLRSATLRHALRPWGSALGLMDRNNAWAKPWPGWLTPDATDRLDQIGVGSDSGLRARRPEQFRGMLGSRAASSAAGEIGHVNRAGAELRYPFRDRRLVQFMLSIPAHQLFNRGLYKYILRNAMRGILPELLRGRGQATSLLPLFVRGIYEREREAVERLLRGPGGRWSDFVRSDWLWDTLNKGYAAPQKVSDGLDQVVLWRCISFELWQRGHVSSGAYRER
ncbi:MAG: hypothetical protein JXA74_09035 [Anaerolineae bacterium]|nr:hypothetical protein [Anaerolineae bacterium]